MMSWPTKLRRSCSAPRHIWLSPLLAVAGRLRSSASGAHGAHRRGLCAGRRILLRRRQSQFRHAGPRNRWVLAAFAVIGVLNARLPAMRSTTSSDLRWRCHPLVWRRAVRCGRRAPPGRFTCSVTASADWSQSRRAHAGHRQIYSVIRNPSHSGCCSILLGWALAFRSGAGLLLTARPLPAGGAHAGQEGCCNRSSAPSTTRIARTWRLPPSLY